MKTWFTCISLIAAPLLHAHEDPHHVIEDLNKRIEKGADLENLYWKRAQEHRSVGHIKSAQRDLLKVIEHDANHFHARLMLAQLEKDTATAKKYYQLASEVADNDEEKALIHIAYADYYYKLGSKENELLALKHCDRALALRENAFIDTELVLFKAHILHCLGHLSERAKFLAEASKKNASVVIRNKNIDAQIDNHSIIAVQDVIKEEIKSSRFTSSWKIRLAKCMVQLGENPSSLLNDAIEEINKRYNPANPDSTLLLDRAAAQALLGNTELAKKDLKSAQTMSHDHFLLREIKESMGLSDK